MDSAVDNAAVMLSPGEIAARDGVSRQAVSKTLKRLMKDHDLPVERDGRGRVMRVSLAHYEHFLGKYSNSARVTAGREQGGEAKVQRPLNDAESRDEALRRQAWLKLQREQIEHEEELGRLIRADRLEDAVVTVGRAIQSEVSRLQNYADDVALAVSKEGTSGARLVLRRVGVEIGNRIADRLAGIAEAAPEGDPVIETEESEA